MIEPNNTTLAANQKSKGQTIMSREQTYTLAAINIAMHKPHSAEQYKSLVTTIYKSRRIIRLGAQHGGMLGRLYRDESPEPDTLMRGELFSFLQLNPHEPWLNLRTGKAAEAGDLAEINLPENLRPAFKAIPFVFSPKHHRMIFVSKHGDTSMAPSTAARLMQRLADPLVANGLFPKINVNPIQDHSTIERVFNLPELRTLNIKLTRPNPGDDDPQGLVRQFESALKDQNATEIEFTTKAARGETLTPSKAVREVANLAASGNGHVRAQGKDSQGRPVKIDTAETPLLLTESFNPKTTTIFDRLVAAASWFK